MTEQKRGGKREGAGRKPIPAEQKTVPKTVRLTQEQITWLEKSGGVSKTIRQLVVEAMNWPH